MTPGFDKNGRTEAGKIGAKPDINSLMAPIGFSSSNSLIVNGAFPLLTAPLNFLFSFSRSPI